MRRAEAPSTCLGRTLSWVPTVNLRPVCVRHRQVLQEEWARFYTAQLALALGALHARKMLYLDLKLENVLLSASGDGAPAAPRPSGTSGLPLAD